MSWHHKSAVHSAVSSAISKTTDAAESNLVLFCILIKDRICYLVNCTWLQHLGQAWVGVSLVNDDSLKQMCLTLWKTFSSCSRNPGFWNTDHLFSLSFFFFFLAVSPWGWLVWVLRLCFELCGGFVWWPWVQKNKLLPTVLLKIISLKLSQGLWSIFCTRKQLFSKKIQVLHLCLLLKHLPVSLLNHCIFGSGMQQSKLQGIWPCSLQFLAFHRTPQYTDACEDAEKMLVPVDRYWGLTHQLVCGGPFLVELSEICS